MTKYWLGKNHSQATKDKISKTKTGVGLSNITKQRMSIARTGEGNPRWKGGRMKHVKGYISILTPEHPFCDHHGYVFEHRLVMEFFLGRYLTKEEVVHHNNGIKDDNRLINLMLFANDNLHKKWHVYLRKLQKELLNGKPA